MDDLKFHSITGAAEMDEPTSSNTLAGDSQVSATSATSSTPNLPTTSSIPTAKKIYSAQTISATSSPRVSRESSPVRPPFKANPSSRSNTGRPRKNSSQDVSPSRPVASTPNPPLSSAALQRGLSASSTPQLYPAISEAQIKAPMPQKPTVTTDLKDAPRWPVSPRLRSPPPVNRPTAAPRKVEQDVPVINVLKPTPTVESTTEDLDMEDALAPPGGRIPARGVIGAGSNVSTLETVQEISLPNTPASGMHGPGEKVVDGTAITESDNIIDYAFAKPSKSKGSVGTNESESEGGGKGDLKMRSTSAAPVTGSRPSVVPATTSFSTGQAVASRSKPSGEGSTKNMTVETETVSSIPQVAVGGGSERPGNNGSIRAKPSSETIRPKKDKKKSTRKAPSVTSGTGEPPDLSCSRRKLHHHHSVRDFNSSIKPESAGRFSTVRRQSSSASPQRGNILRKHSLNVQSVSNMLTRQPTPASSKADIFEAKIASAVDEANSSDSEETFVYESNPPEAVDRPRRFHSRTPSATSMASQADQRGNNVRSMHGVMDSGHSVALKKSMKFANSFNTNGSEPGNAEDDGKGTARSNMGTGRGTTHHHHIGRWGRNVGNGHQSLFDNESPFPNVAKTKLSGNGSRNSSRPTSPRVSQIKNSNGKKSAVPLGYDIDDGAGADDERTPLMGSTIRSNRTVRRRPQLSLRQLEHQARHETSFLNRFAGCLVLAIMILLVVSGAIGFMFATTQPLTEVQILALNKVLASEQEIMFDMEVMARNPNLVVISVESMDVKVFAKSKHVGTDLEWWRRPQNDNSNDSRRRPQLRATRRRDVQAFNDAINDPPIDDDDPSETNTMLLGHLLAFDSPLLFEGSPFKHAHSIANGSVSLGKPGNGTDAGGTERWERVLQYEFDLIVRGVLKYQLPMSQRVRSVAVDGLVTVKPNRIVDTIGIGRKRSGVRGVQLV